MTAGVVPAAREANRTDAIGLIRAAAKDFSRDQCGLRAAALCYYTVFAVPPLLIVLIAVAGLIWSPDTVRRAMESQFSQLIGADGARAVRDMVSSSQQFGHGVLATVLGVGGLVAGATGAFLSLQDALNAVWEVGPDPARGGVRRFIAKRLLSLGMVMGLGFLTIVSLAVSAALSALGGLLGDGVLMQALSMIVSAATLSAIFAAMFKFLPDAVVGWRSVWVGGIATAILFEVGKVVIGLYLGRSHPGTAFGAASALAVILVWIYYAGMLVLFGAEFTQEYATSRGHGIRPRGGAVRIVRKEQIVHDLSGEPIVSDKRTMSVANGTRTDAGRVMPHGIGSGNGRPAVSDASIAELFKSLSTDSGHLVQQEIALAKAEAQESLSVLAGGAGKIGAAVVLALPGLMAVTAAIVIGLGILIHSYWISAAIVGVVILAISGVLIKRAIDQFKCCLVPTETIKTVRDDADWAKEEVTRLKQELRAEPGVADRGVITAERSNAR